MLASAERAKYESIWSIEDYGKHSPGEELVELFGEIAKPVEGLLLADLGCGTGRAGAELKRCYGLGVVLMDITDKGLKVELPFRKQCLWEPIRGAFDYGYCCDVMEHIPPEYVMLTLHNIFLACTKVFFNISFIPDQFGKRIGQPLHLTVMPFQWWKSHLEEFGEVVEARDCLSDGIFYVRRKAV